ncbi:putative tetratricopeptide-like helical domain, DYW domain-containing protein [Rosa chinensis]|uniref:Putative tetratricopeptide-like helical domain, DYW domain-containing protein n=1 Tax=Rosa chinensis TaxID=74649 RepID=A0A2P6QWR2_ROSCH|nr:pentatricopeptide repeat-containing protein At4g14820 [Rosa chinensis]PRQ38606.1 putative tetratricopeptide-like helical domain, DYW domain-containing protein [Rosa chinensis]
MSTLPCTTLSLPRHPNPKPSPTILFTTPTTLFTSLSSSTNLKHLKQVHAQILKSNLDRSDSLLFKLLLSSFTLSPTLHYPLSLFTQIPKPQTHLCNKLLRELSRCREPEKALLVYERMRREGVALDRFSFPPLLKAVSRASALAEGIEIHGLVCKLGFDLDPFVQTVLVRMYAACGRVMDARLVFDKMPSRDVVAWSIMIDGYCQSGHYDIAFNLFEEMKNSDVKPDEMILSTILSACGRAGKLTYGKAVHDFIEENEIVVDSHILSALIALYAGSGCMDLAQQLFDKTSEKNFVVATAMVSGYSKLGRVEDARLIFDQIVQKDLVCWSAMISGYAESDRPQEALRLFSEMKVSGLRPDQVTMLSVISACAHLGALDQAKWVHLYVDKNGFGGALSVNNALIDMYAKCGSLERARGVFEKMPRRNVITWTTMISAFAMHGDASNALNFFNQMKLANVEPNGVTFVGVLYACSHAGLVEQGRQIFASMVNEYNITPKHEHYGCMVDLYGRANLLREALEVIETMPLAPNVVIWGSLMAACQIHGEIELGEFAAKQVLELEPDHDGALVVLSNIYAKERRWEEVGMVRKIMKNNGISKQRGCSRIELKNEIYEFLMADRSHKQADQIYEKLDEVVREVKQVGYTPNTCNILVDLEEEEKKEAILWHSEKLALSFGLIGAKKGSCIRIVKNLRICEDCHTFMKLASKVYDREIIVRDRTRFHHYKHGYCSCKDYW